MPDRLLANDAAYRAFLIDDYEACVEIILKGVTSTQMANLLLISLHRLDRTEAMDSFEGHYLERLEPYPWDHSLVSMTLGKLDPVTVFARATTDNQRCAACYYAAELNITLGDVDAARVLFGRCLEYREDSIEHTVAQIQRSRLGSATEPYPTMRNLILGRLRRLAQLLLAREIASAALLARELQPTLSALVEGDPLKNRLAFEVGSTLYRAGDFVNAAPLLSDTVRRLRVAGLEGSPRYENVLQGYAQALLHLGRWGDALPELERVLEIRKTSVGDSHPDYALALHNLGSAHIGLGNMEVAVRLLERSLRIQRGDPDSDYGSTLNSLATIHIEAHRFGLAEKLFREAAELHDTRGDTASYHTTMYNLAQLMARQRRFTEAAATIAMVLEQRRAGGTQSELDIAMQTAMSSLLVQGGHYEEAYWEAAAAWEAAPEVLGPTHPRLAELAEILAIAALHTSRGMAAGEALRSLVAQLDARLRQVATSSSARGRARSLQAIRRSAGGALSLLVENLPLIENSGEIASSIMLRFKGVEARLAALRTSSASADAQNLIGDLGLIAERMHELAMNGILRSGRAGKEMVDPVLAFRAEQQRLQDERDELELRLSHMVDPNGLAAVEPGVVAQQIPPGWILVEFGRSSRFNMGSQTFEHLPRLRYSAAIIPTPSAGEQVAIDLGPAEPIDEAIAIYRETLGAEPSSRASWELIQAAMSEADNDLVGQFGASVRRLIFDPLLPHLGDSHHVLISPDGEINSMPFEVLPLGDGRSLLDKYTFSYLSSGSELLGSASSIPDGLGLSVVVAAPDYDLATVDVSPTVEGNETQLRAAMSGQHFGLLPETEAEGRLVGELLESVVKPDGIYGDHCVVAGRMFL